LLDKVVDELHKFTAISHGMRQTIEQIRRDKDSGDTAE